jgi:hypothetical protein
MIRRHHDPLHAGARAGLLQVAGRGDEELRRRLLLGRRSGGHVDDHLDTRQGLGQAVAADHVHAVRARDRDGVVASGPEQVDDVAAGPPACPGYCDLHDGGLLVTSGGLRGSLLKTPGSEGM